MATMSLTSPVYPGLSITVTIFGWSGNPAEYVGIYYPPGDPLDVETSFPPPFGYAPITTLNATDGTATLAAPTGVRDYSMRLRDSTDPAVSSLLITLFTVVSLPEYVGIYYAPGDPLDIAPVFPPPFGYAYTTAVSSTISTATLPAPTIPGPYSMRLRNSTDQTVGSLVIEPIDVVMTPAAQSPSSIHYSRYSQYWHG